MDIQLKKGLLELCVLRSLVENDSYGYQIIKDISDVLEIKESTLYPILKRLEVGKYLVSYSMEHNSRLRKYYKITPLGKKRIADFTLEWENVSRVYEYIKDGIYE